MRKIIIVLTLMMVWLLPLSSMKANESNEPTYVVECHYPEERITTIGSTNNGFVAWEMGRYGSSQGANCVVWKNGLPYLVG